MKIIVFYIFCVEKMINYFFSWYTGEAIRRSWSSPSEGKVIRLMNQHQNQKTTILILFNEKKKSSLLLKKQTNKKHWVKGSFKQSFNLKRKGDVFN